MNGPTPVEVTPVEEAPELVREHAKPGANVVVVRRARPKPKMQYKRPGAAREARRAAHVALLARRIRNQDQLEQILADCQPGTRQAVFDLIKPHLTFTSAEDSGKPIADCPNCGLRRGSVIQHECQA